VAHRIISLLRSNLVAFEAKQTVGFISARPTQLARVGDDLCESKLPDGSGAVAAILI
jgi:hypothetical protein